MEIHADFTQRIVLHGAQMPWVDSPMAGVQRRMFDRIGAEVARATSIVRYEPGSKFSAHMHGGGEEFIVLEGVFQDEHGDYPVGTYVRNPPTTQHTPGSASGCTIFVKLWQFDPADRTSVIINMDKIGQLPDPALAGVAVTPLFEDTRETVQVETWQAGAQVQRTFVDGAELLVLAGDLQESGEQLQPMSWLRLPRGAALSAVAGSAGARVWVKSRHLRFIDAPVAG